MMKLKSLRYFLTSASAIAFLSLITGCDFISSFTGGGDEGETTVNEVPASPPASPTQDPAAQAPASPTPVDPATVENPFVEAVRRATSAAEATQNASTPEEWQAVATNWESAISLMQAVPQDNPNYQKAQDRIPVYQKNLAYARNNAGG
ncbi:MAG: hypothetical protein SAJ12_00705 [Jaaginema sp. PMC 1079.18]|nr:hypothetical protein [Jaaginema sp. PMC 1080.18]MEC4849503.1 hypothetical protein [Jaaginema sp. PMC 1079.18]MEC4865618.1 hypothetical protein [Jaaginema sp. PMC 1078.18]